MKQPIISTLLLVISCCAAGQNLDARKNNFNVRKGVAIEGYDPVSYFDNKQAKGDEDFSFSYKGITYLFSNADNLTRFKVSPDKFEPAYGGWCAYAMGAQGEKVKIDPETYKIIEGKLYLFYNFWGNNTLSTWDKSEKVLKSKGDQNWGQFVR